ncbi:putative vesicle-associated membrane protein 726, partial [Phtheirospermum japonicum]
SFVERGTVILAEYTEFIGNFTGISAQCLQKLFLPTTSSPTTAMATPSITSLMMDLVSACHLRSARSFNLICII